ncbi:MAG: hypothetical protein GX248_01040 [Peptococcaceae bacterium]|jgi:glucose-1-phosphate thymidylyltransferase|nr:hypothetical protein [Peptococcaceae bacterium]
MKGLILLGDQESWINHSSWYPDDQLLSVLNKPNLFYNIDLLLKAGVTEIGIVVESSKKGYVREELISLQYFKKASIALIEVPEIKCLSRVVLRSRPFLAEDDFVMIVENHYCQINLKEAIKFFTESKAQSLVALKETKDVLNYTVTVSYHNEIKSINEEAKLSKNNWALTGFYIFQPSIHEILSSQLGKACEEDEILYWLQYVIGSGRSVKAWFLEGYCREIKSSRDLLETNIDLLKLESQNIMKLPYRTILSRVNPPVLIDKTAVVLNSVIGPNVIIGRNALVKNSKLENSLILENSCVRGIQAKNTIFTPWGHKEV